LALLKTALPSSLAQTKEAAMSTTEDRSPDATGTAVSFGSARDLADAMRRASVAHGEHEKRIGEADPDWPDWYAAYMVAEQTGTDLPK
jgi:hypothetical protein